MTRYLQKPEFGPHGGNVGRVPGSNRDKVLSAVEAEPEISVETLMARTGLGRNRIVQILSAEGYLRTEDDRHPCGNPNAVTALLKALKRAHPTGGQKVLEARAPRWMAPVNLAARSYTGCSAATTAERGEMDWREKQEARS